MTPPRKTGPPTPPPLPADGREGVVTRHRRLVARTFLVSALTLMSRCLGLVREVVMGALFGHQSPVLDAFFTAFRVPNLFRRLFGEGALSTSLQTALTEADAEEGNVAGRGLFLQTISLTAWILLGVSAAAMAFVWWMPDAMPITGWPWLGADPEPVRDLAIRLLPFVVLVCITALCGGALQVRGHYTAPNLAPSVMNLVWIGALVWVGLAFGWAESGKGAREAVFGTQWTMARWLAWGILAGGAVQLLLHVPPLLRLGLLPSRRPAAAPIPIEPRGADGRHRTAWGVLRASAPLAFGAAIYQINVMIDGLMAEGLLADGGPTVLYLANRVQQFPLALVAISTVNAVFPSLKALGHNGRLGEMRRLHDRSQFAILFLALPATAGLFVLAEPISAVLFERGNFGPEGVVRMADTLQMLAVALVPAGAASLMARAYYARNDFVTPVRISCAMLVANVALNALFVRVFHMDADGLALATAVTSWGNLALLHCGLHRRLELPASEGGLGLRLVRSGLASIACGAVALGLHAAVAGVIGGEEGEARRSVLALLAGAIGGLATYLVLAKILAIPEWVDFRDRVRRRLGSER